MTSVDSLSSNYPANNNKEGSFIKGILMFKSSPFFLFGLTFAYLFVFWIKREKGKTKNSFFTNKENETLNLLKCEELMSSIFFSLELFFCKQNQEASKRWTLSMQKISRRAYAE